MTLLNIALFLNLFAAQGFCVYFSTKTPYDMVGNFHVEPIFPDSHEVVYMRYLGRHGERFPSLSDCNSIKSFYERLSLLSGDLEGFLNISKLLFDSRKDKFLSPRGIKQLFHIGRRYRQRLSGVFDETPVSAQNFKFESTCKSRSVHSMIAFIAGMFELDENSIEIPEIQTFPCENDLLFCFFDFCERYSTMQRCLKTSMKEQELFLNSDHMKNIAKQISRLLGLKGQLDSTDVKSLYMLCVYGLALNGGSLDQGPCRVFDEESLSAFEYLLDIKSFFQRANAYSLNIKMACKLFQRIYESVISSLNSCPRTCTREATCKEEFKADLGFAHAETLIPILGYLGLYGAVNSSGDLIDADTNVSLTAKNYYTLRNKRSFFGGYLSPMAGNIVLAVGCPRDGISEGVVMALLNEHPVSLPCCEGAGLDNNSRFPVCTKKQFEKCFKELAQDCDYGDLCSNPYQCNKS